VVLWVALAVGFLGLVLLRNDSIPVAAALLMQVPIVAAFAWVRRNPPEDGGGGPEGG
jgi:hypothetical protein